MKMMTFRGHGGQPFVEWGRTPHNQAEDSGFRTHLPSFCFSLIEVSYLNRFEVYFPDGQAEFGWSLIIP